MIPTTQPHHHRALRDELVAMVNATPRPKRSMRRGPLVTLVAGFTIVGAFGGGAITAAAQANSTAPTVFDVAVSGESFTAASELFGTPVMLAGRGESIIRMGTPPAGATSVAMAIKCVTPGDISIELNDTKQAFLTCDTDQQPSTGGMATQYQTVGTGSQTFTVRADRSTQYVVWASWSAEPEKAAASADQQSELGDGQITRSEYEAAFDRFAACMSEANYPVIGVDKSDTVIRYSTSGASTESGTEAICYDREFAQVDEAWQLANE